MPTRMEGESPRLSGECGEVLGERAAYLARENLRHRGDRTGGFVEGHALHAGHGEKHGGQADAFALRCIDLANEVVERVEINATYGDARGSDGQQLAPHLLARRVQTDDNDGMSIHG